MTIDKTIREYFSQELIWNSNVYRFNDKDFAILSVEDVENKPVICTKNKGALFREGAIYYRYREETKEIEYPELQRIIDKEREKEKVLWMQHIQQISSIGPKNVHLLDTYKGEISVGNGKILIDKKVLDKIKFVKEGNLGKGWCTNFKVDWAYIRDCGYREFYSNRPIIPFVYKRFAGKIRS